MSTQAQLLANQENGKKSHGAITEEGHQICSQNAVKHGLTQRIFGADDVALLADESLEKYSELEKKLTAELKPTGEQERILVRNMVNHDWLRARAMRLQAECLAEGLGKAARQRFALLMRYESMQTRGYHKNANELQKLRKEAKKAEIGFVSQTLKQAAEKRAAERHQVFQKRSETLNPTPNRTEQPAPAANASPGALEKAA